MGITKKVIKPGDEPSPEAIKRLDEAARRPIVYDDESPYYTFEELKAMAEKTRRRKEQEKKPVIALRVTPSTLERAKATGKGYTGFMSRLLDLAMADPVMVKKALEEI